jgi:hypothetical protein
MIRLGMAIVLALGLAGCVTTSGPGSVAGGECKAFLRPPYVVLGRAQYDQDWIDQAVETGVGACRWARPAARPAELDANQVKPAPAAPARRAGWLARARSKIGGLAGNRARRPPQAAAAPAPASPAPAAFPTAPVAPVALPPAPVAPAAPPPKPPRSKLDQLLHPHEE